MRRRGATLLFTDDPEVMAETRGWLGVVLTRRDAAASALEALYGALSGRLPDDPWGAPPAA